MSVALKAIAGAWRFTQTENDSPGSCKFDPLNNQNCPKYRRVATPQCPKHRGVVLLSICVNLQAHATAFQATLIQKTVKK